MRRNKVVYSDSGKDRTAFGIITKEDDFFITLKCDDGHEERIGKKAIIRIKPMENREGSDGL